MDSPPDMHLSFVTCLNQCATWTGASGWVSSSASSDSLAFLFRTSSLPLLINAAWSALLNSSCPLSAATRCPDMTQDSIPFSGSVIVGSGRDRPYCFTGRCVTLLPMTNSPIPYNRSYMKDYRRAFMTFLNAFLMSGVTWWNDSHYCCSELCSS